MKNSVSVVVVNYNAGEYLTQCASSVLSQASELIVVDNGSADSSLEELERSYAGDQRVRVVRNNANLGFAAACNIGYHQTRGNEILFLNPDCRLDNGALEEMLKALNSGERTGMVGGLLLNDDGSEQRGGRRMVPTPWRSFIHAFQLHRLGGRWPRLFIDFHLHKQPLPENPIEVEAISGSCMLVKRQAVAEVGLWDQAYFLHCEDLDWCMRFRQHGWRILFVPHAKIWHARGVCGKGRHLFVEWHKHRGMVRFYRKFFRRQYPWPVFPLVWLGVWFRFGVLATLQQARKLTAIKRR